METNNDIFFYLKKHWGYNSFRPMQQDIIESVLNNIDTLVLLPTGGGKSLCFQIPGLVIGGTCLVISPLIALMNDQVQNLKAKGISAVAITSAMNNQEIDIALNNAAYGHVQFLYVSPERIENESFKQKLSYLPIGLIAVDEAHCISQWGYDFRPSYLKIAALREFFPKVKIIALTASATNTVVEDIQQKLAFTDQNVFRQSFERKNIRYVVQQEENKFDRLLKIIINIGGTGIIYVRNRKKTEEISKWLNQKNLNTSYYHAGLKSNDRAVIQQNWIDNKQQIIVSTNAFGMGIDKPDVRFVVHLDLPDSLEAYFQEAGRAGRDEKIAYAVLLCNQQDVLALREFYEANSPSPEQIKQTYQALFNFYQIPVESGEGLTVTFNIDELIRNYNLKALVVYNSIKCLEKDGYLTLLDTGYEPSKVMIKMRKDDLYQFQIKFPKYESLIKVLLRSYGGLFESYQHIKENDVAYRSKISVSELHIQLDILMTHGVLSFIPQTTLPKIIFLQNRINIKNYNIPLIHYPILKEKALARINSVINYVNESKICRSRLLLSYFNQTNTKDCNYCDVCIDKYKELENITTIVKASIKHILKNTPLTFDDLIKSIPNINSKTLASIINMMLDDEEILMHANKTLQLNL